MPAAVLRTVASAMPLYLRHWVSYCRFGRLFTPLEMERTRLAITTAMDPALAANVVAGSNGGSPPEFLTRSDFNHRLRVGILRAVRLDLHKTPPLSILDIGCGAGFFIAASKHFGHRCIGTDLPREQLSSAMSSAYENCLRALGCLADRRTMQVKAFEPLDFDERVDLIAAGLICFNEYGGGRFWSRREWEFFLNDVRRCLEPNGRLFLELNEHAEFGRLRWYDRETKQLFESVGTVDSNKIMCRAERLAALAPKAAVKPVSG